MGRFARQFGEVYDAVSTDIFKFCRAMNFSPTWQQEELLGAVQRGDKQIAVRSGQGPGKTTVTVVTAMFRSLRAFNALTILTAPTMRQCNEVWLAEARRLIPNADPWIQKMFKVTRTKIVVAGYADWGVKTVTASKDMNAQGFHEKNMTIICEEASGISRKIIEQFQGTASNPNSLFLMIGNPNLRDCAFFDCFNRDKRRWTCLHWNAEQTPRSEWFDPARNKKLEDAYGRESDVYRIRVLGEFPKADPNCVLSSEEVEAVMDKRLMLPMSLALRPNGKKAKQFGLDFARFGGDENVLVQRQGEAVIGYEHEAHIEPVVMVRRAFARQHRFFWTDADTWYVPDAGGMGQGMMFMFHEAGKNVLEFHNGGAACDGREYDNRVTEAWFNFRKKVRAKRAYLPYDPILLEQLSNRQYYITKKGKFVLESKDDYMDRGHDSPDRADGTVTAFYDEVEATGNITTRNESKHRVGQLARSA